MAKGQKAPHSATARTRHIPQKRRIGKKKMAFCRIFPDRTASARPVHRPVRARGSKATYICGNALGHSLTVLSVLSGHTGHRPLRPIARKRKRGHNASGFPV